MKYFCRKYRIILLSFLHSTNSSWYTDMKTTLLATSDRSITILAFSYRQLSHKGMTHNPYLLCIQILFWDTAFHLYCNLSIFFHMNCLKRANGFFLVYSFSVVVVLSKSSSVFCDHLTFRFSCFLSGVTYCYYKTAWMLFFRIVSGMRFKITRSVRCLAKKFHWIIHQINHRKVLSLYKKTPLFYCVHSREKSIFQKWCFDNPVYKIGRELFTIHGEKMMLKWDVWWL